jgi:acetoin utilization protein AcuC
VLYVDLDVHHGDGVEYAFREDPSVFTYSIHETPAVRWPGTGYAHDRGAGAGLGFAMNVPVHPHTTDASWLAAVQRTLVPAARRFRPDLILSQHGCDPHAEDPLATLELTTGAFFESAKLVRDLTAELCGGRWVATGGGGYRPHHVIPRAWSIVWAVLSERELPVRVDEAWRRDWQARAGEPLPELFLDVPPPEAERHRVAARANERTVREVLGHHGL